ncbi:SDR family NAD(P)-dependent oxidoreductase [Williamsia sp. MIQD14]|uniref:SDR family NAD(P)-dependent oxidoreductase n=1 Tax=Williamsia sp. MIQD14 TaxID=3425703 RepID=UPI003DA09D80
MTRKESTMFTPSRSLITGASAGIGTALAHRLAERGSDLVLVARREDRLRDLASELESAHGITCDVVALDLSGDRPGAMLRARVEGDVDLVVNNAGIAIQGSFIDAEAADLGRVIAVDMAALVDVCHAFLPDMAARGAGTILNVASTTAFQPVPTLAVYAAAKAFVLSFTQALWCEARTHGVRVMALAPGPTATEFFDVIGDDAAIVGSMQTADQVARTALSALDRRRPPLYVISGRRNTLAAAGARLTPNRLLLPMMTRSMRHFS